MGILFVKTYDNKCEGAYEYAVLKRIAAGNPFHFTVPKTFKIKFGTKYSFIIMEWVRGSPLKNAIIRFLLSRDYNALKVLNNLGRALKEFHFMDLGDLRGCIFPGSLSELKLEVRRLSSVLRALRVISCRIESEILEAIEGLERVSNNIFVHVNLHGEFYFTHVAIMNGKFVFFDFHNACRGPAYFDLAMFSISLYASITLPYLNPTRLTPLVDAFLSGYFGRLLNDEVLKSVRLAELYVALREILMFADILRGKNSCLIKLVSLFKIMRLKTAIEKVILPGLRG